MGRKKNIPIDVPHKRKRRKGKKRKGSLLAGLESLKPAGRIVHGVLACAFLAAHVGWIVQPVRSYGPQ